MFAVQVRRSDTHTKLSVNRQYCDYHRRAVLQTYISMAKKMPTYLAATPLAVPRRMYPTAANREKKVTNGPLTRTLSVSQAVMRITKKHRR